MKEKKDNFFLKSIKGANPIKKSNKIKKETKKTTPLFYNKSKENKEEESQIKKNNKAPIKNFSLELVNTNKMLRKGQITINKKIDFHGKSLLESENEFNRVLLECYNKKKRCILFVTGKGLHNRGYNKSNEKPKLFYGKIREAFLKWVRQKKYAKLILSINTADSKHGGDGAFFVYLRKKPNL